MKAKIIISFMLLACLGNSVFAQTANTDIVLDKGIWELRNNVIPDFHYRSVTHMQQQTLAVGCCCRRSSRLRHRLVLVGRFLLALKIRISHFLTIFAPQNALVVE